MSLTIDAREFVTFIGPSGSGRATPVDLVQVLSADENVQHPLRLVRGWPAERRCART